MTKKERLERLEEAVFKFKEHPSALMCEHTNENPNICKCPPDCYCRTRTCKDKGQFEDDYGMGRPGWLKCKRCLSSMLEANAKTHVCNPAHGVDIGPRMVPIAMIPLETHRKRLEEFAAFVKHEHLRSHEKQSFPDAVDAELARLLEET